MLESTGSRLHMFVPPKDPFREQWDGFRTGVEGVQEIFNADSALENSQGNIVKYVRDLVKRNDTVYFDSTSANVNLSHRSVILDTLKSSASGKRIVTSTSKVRQLVGEQRLVKSAAEIKLMRCAGRISGRAYNQAFARRFRNERTLHSFLEYQFISGGCDKSAYVPVVAAGSNALCIHYTRNDDVMFDDEMVLVDAAGALGGYCADISRTWPISGTFTQPQRDLYQAVLNVQRKCISLCKAENAFSLHDIHEKSVQFMRQELLNLGIAHIRNWDVTRLYPHYIGHNLGLDVHDVPQMSRYEPLKSGQVITMEPGLYIPDDPEIPEYFRNVGIRIEDDIAVHDTTYTNLTVEAVKELDDLENVMQNGTMTKPREDVINPLDDL